LSVFDTEGNMRKTPRKSDQSYIGWGLYMYMSGLRRQPKRSFDNPLGNFTAFTL